MADALGAKRTLYRWLPVLAVAIWWAIRLGTTGLVPFETGISVGVFTHFGLTLVVALIAAFQVVGEPSFISRFKASLKPAVLYALLAAASTVCYHHVVCAENTALRMLERETFIDRSLADETAFAALQADDPQLAMMDIETARERAKASLRFQFDPLWHFTASLLMWIAAAMSTVVFTSFLGQWFKS